MIQATQLGSLIILVEIGIIWAPATPGAFVLTTRGGDFDLHDRLFEPYRYRRLAACRRDAALDAVRSQANGWAQPKET